LTLRAGEGRGVLFREPFPLEGGLIFFVACKIGEESGKRLQSKRAIAAMEKAIYQVLLSPIG